jgi:Zn-dependent protease
VALILGVSGSHQPVPLLIWVAAVFISILVHELGHAVVMRLFGLWSRIVLYGMGGLTIPDMAAGAGRWAMRPPAQVLISLAGPLAGFALAAGLAALLVLTGHGSQLYLVEPLSIRPFVFGLPNQTLQALVNDVFYVSVFWGLMNLLPIYPLDGGQVAQEVLRSVNPRDGVRQSLMLSVFTALLVVAVAIVRWQDIYVALLFGYLAYSSYAALSYHSGRGPW